jgi:hypothetical protein
MLVRLMVERGQDVCSVKLAGAFYTFKRNEHGHLVSDISDLLTIKWVSDPRNSSFMPYNPPKSKGTIPPPAVPPVTSEPETEGHVADEVFEEVVRNFSEPVAPPPGGQVERPERETMTVNPEFEGGREDDLGPVLEGGAGEVEKIPDAPEFIGDQGGALTEEEEGV